MERFEVNGLTVPYLPSQKWMSEWIEHRLAGKSAVEAAVIADRCIDRRQMGRTLISGANGTQLLTIPVTGGASVWKRRNLNDVEISQHGNWQHTHLGAIEAAYARTPYFDTLFDALKPLYSKAEGSLALFNAAILEVLISFINIETLSDGITRRRKCQDRILAEWCDAGKKLYREEISVLDPLMRYGPDTLYILLR